MRRTSYFSKINATQTSIASIPDISKEIQEIRIIHSSLVSMEGLSIFKLKILNLSSNHIQRIEGIEHMKSLEQINLSNNKIKLIECIDYLINLQKLILFNNQVTSLEGLKHLSNNGMNKLKLLDMRGNALNDTNQLQFLTGFGHLQQVMFDVGKASNSMCENKQDYYRQIFKHIKSSVKKIDNKSYSDLQRSIMEQPSKISEQKQNRDVSNIQDTRMIQQTYGVTRFEILELQKIISHKQLVIEQLKSKNLQSTTQLHQNYKDFLKLQHQLQKTEAYRQQLQKRHTKKDKQFQDLQNQLNDMMRQNGKLAKDIYNKNGQMEKYIKQISQLKIENAEHRAVLKDNQKRMHDFHSKALQNVNNNSAKMQQIKKNYQKLYRDFSIIQIENTNLKQRVQELNEICRQWQFKYQRTHQQFIHNIEKQLRKQKHQYQKKLQTDEKNHKQQTNSRHLKYKQQLTSVEVEFKGALTQLGQKYKKIKKDYEDTSRSDMENKKMLKITLDKNAELEGIILETQSSLERFRKDFMKLMQEKQSLLRQNQQLKNGKNQQWRNLIEEKDKLAYERSYLERQLTNTRQKMTALEYQLERGGKIQQLNTAIEVKNQMLEDKNQTIQTLKDELKQVRRMQTELQTLKGKYEQKKMKLKQNQKYLESVLIENQDLRDQSEQLEAQLTNIKEQLSIKEENLTKIQTYLNEFSGSLKQKQDNITELLGIVQQSKGVITRRTEEAQIYKKQAQNIKRQFSQKYDFYKNRQNKFEKTIENLNHTIQNLQKQKAESDKNMKNAKQVLENLTKHFNK